MMVRAVSCFKASSAGKRKAFNQEFGRRLTFSSSHKVSIPRHEIFQPEKSTFAVTACT